MKKILLSLFVLVSLQGWSQDDTVFVNQYQLADTIFKGIDTKSQTGYVFNRLFADPDSVISWNSHLFESDTSMSTNADFFYVQMDELKKMAIDTSSVVSLIELFDSTSVFMAEYEFEEERYIYPVGILDFNFDVIDLEQGLSSGILSKSDEVYSDNQPTNFSICETRNTKLVAPLFDLYSSDDMGLVFRSSNFFSNYRTLKDIEKLEIYKDGIWTRFNLMKYLNFLPNFHNIRSLNFA